MRFLQQFATSCNASSHPPNQEKKKRKKENLLTLKNFEVLSDNLRD